MSLSAESPSARRGAALLGVLRNAAWKLPTLALIVVLAFFLLNLAPGDLADTLAGEVGAASPEFMDQLRLQYGLDQPLMARFWAYVTGILQLDFGYSFRFGMPVLDLIGERLPATILLALTSLVIALVLGVVAGTISALTRARWPDMVLSTLSTLGFATPLFWVGLMAIYFFSVEMRWLPTGGLHSVRGATAGDLTDRLTHLILPSATLSIFYVSIFARIVRAAVLEVLDADYVRTARAKGLTRSAILLGHVLRNALLPVVTITGLEAGTLLSGTITVETVFSWPGLGRLAYEAVTQRDVNLLIGILLISALLITAINLLLDLVYTLIDPRVRAQ